MSKKELLYQDEITLKELILKIKEYVQEVFKSWAFVAFICILTSAYFAYKHFTFVPKYTAELRFVVEGQGGANSGLGGLLGSFGIKRGGGVNAYKILEVGKSTKLFNQLMYTKINGGSTIAQMMIDDYGLIEEWLESNEDFKGYEFGKGEDIIEKSALKKLKSLVWGSPGNKKDVLSSFRLDEDTGIYEINTKSTSETLSIAITTELYTSIKTFFEDEIFENQKRSAQILAVKADSLKNLKDAKIYQLARFEDRNKSLLLKENETQRAVLTQEIQALSHAYGEILKSYEMTDVNLKDLQPLFIEIDRPFTPISPSSSSLFRQLFFGLLIGVIFGSMLVIGRKIYLDIME